MSQLDEDRDFLRSSLLLFTQYFFEYRTGKPYLLSDPPGRMCRHRLLCHELEKVFLGENKRLLISYPPRYGKTELIVHFMAWALSFYPDSCFIYASFAQQVATRQTQLLRDILCIPRFQELFGFGVDPTSSAKHNFKTTAGGEILGVGSGGPITSRGGGIAGLNGKRFGGALIFDDLHKPLDVLSDTIRESDNQWFYNTFYSRLNDPINTPIIGIGQRLHEDDIFSHLAAEVDEDGKPIWRYINLPSRDENRNVLDPSKHTLEMLDRLEKLDPYTFWSQYQGTPQPAGGSVFKKDDFVILDEEPKIEMTFITADTAETAHDYNDATVFSFWGLYKVSHRGIETGNWALHWLGCREIRVEPRDLENEFMDFYLACMKHRVKPRIAAIEKKSTGVTLCSVLKKVQGLRILDIERTREGGSKTARFLACQPYVADGLVSFTYGSKHLEMCLEHMSKITANDSHRHDDIADTMQAAIQLALIEQAILPKDTSQVDTFAAELNARNSYISTLRTGL